MCLSLSETETAQETKKIMTTTGGQTVKVRRTKLASCLTCPLCDKFFRDATTISECLHTFCRECIRKKLRDEYLKHCPVCKVNLGCAPLDKLRVDHSLQDLREKLFPHEEESAKAPESVPSFPLPTKRKERSLSSLGANPTKLSSHSSIVARRAKTAAKRVFAGKESARSTVQTDKRSDDKKDERHGEVEILEDIPRNLSGAKAAARKKFIPREYTPSTSQPHQSAGDNKKDRQHCELETENVISGVKNSLEPDLSQQKVPNETSEKNAELWKGKTGMWEPLNYLMEAARKAKSTVSTNMQENAEIAMPIESCDNDSHAPTVEVKSGNKIKAAGDQNEATPVQADPVKTKRLRSSQQRRVKFSQDLNVPAQPVPGSSSKSNERFSPIWFSLVASEEKEVGARLPQIPSCYLRVKDDSLPVSFIKKYIMKKLDLASEAEVEISLRGEPVLASLQLKNLVDMWLETVPKSETIHSFVGSSAKDFVMVLSYGRKAS